jgi:hypothetical protein
MRPVLVDYPESIAALLEATEQGVRAALQVLEIEGEVLA